MSEMKNMKNISISKMSGSMILTTAFFVDVSTIFEVLQAECFCPLFFVNVFKAFDFRFDGDHLWTSSSSLLTASQMNLGLKFD